MRRLIDEALASQDITEEIPELDDPVTMEISKQAIEIMQAQISDNPVRFLLMQSFFGNYLAGLRNPQ